MRKYGNLLFLISILSFVLQLNIYAGIPARPNPPRLVNDFAEIIPHNQERFLEYKLKMYNDSTSTQIAVVTLQSLGGDAPFNVAHEILEKWGVGQKGLDNGIVVLVAPNERKTFISTGYGIEATLTDALSKRIIENYIVPYFKQGDFYGGIHQATDAIFGVLTGQYKSRPPSSDGDDFVVVLFIILVIIFFVILPMMNSRNRQYYYEGDEYDSTTKKRSHRSRGRSWNGPIIITNDWGGGSSGSFGGGSGGFGGFGGGSGGGGGAGGDW